jgi:hypothetical protein
MFCHTLQLHYITIHHDESLKCYGVTFFHIALMLQTIFCHITILIHAIILHRTFNSRCFVTPHFENRLFVHRYIIPEPLISVAF